MLWIRSVPQWHSGDFWGAIWAELTSELGFGSLGVLPQMNSDADPLLEAQEESKVKSHDFALLSTRSVYKIKHAVL